MKKYIKFLLVIVLTILATSVVTSNLVLKNARAAFVSASIDMEAFNELHRIRSRESLEQLLIKGCNKEALEYVQMEQSLGLLSLQDRLNNGAKLDKTLQTENASILNRAKSTTNEGKYYIPSCS
ncbi:MAG: hypothetical protein Q7T42_06760 [Methylotenera sp.]|uniref:hypothetical protein n=1 Tax=Methylotenera sp. TaxID=2051956 RepID=UPI00271AD94A|nr:hypothetical protein [Methylotenera sp.]MDO9206508.1 hypothetical protein [Methylotenera sp.]MDO9393653.1 hypothetical protein [Methylotenera sp.]MDP1521915.1 hypothetical protein [Methylotenera sp.]